MSMQETYDACAVFNLSLTSSYQAFTPPAAAPKVIYKTVVVCASAFTISTDGTNGLDVPANTPFTLYGMNPFTTTNGSKLQFKTGTTATLQVVAYGSNAG